MRPGSLAVAPIPADSKILVASSIFLSDATSRFSLVTLLTIPIPSISALAARPLENIWRPYQWLRLGMYGVQNVLHSSGSSQGAVIETIKCSSENSYGSKGFSGSWNESVGRRPYRSCYGAQHCFSLEEVKRRLDLRTA